MGISAPSPPFLSSSQAPWLHMIALELCEHLSREGWEPDDPPAESGLWEQKSHKVTPLKLAAGETGRPSPAEADSLDSHPRKGLKSPHRLF